MNSTLRFVAMKELAQYVAPKRKAVEVSGPRLPSMPISRAIFLIGFPREKRVFRFDQLLNRAPKSSMPEPQNLKFPSFSADC
jgi:hypothetical protein